VPRSIKAEEFSCRDQSIIRIANDVTICQFKALAEVRGWSTDWLVEQCKDEMDHPRETVRGILAGRGLTKPWFMGQTTKPKLVSMLDTVLMWTPLLDLYSRYHWRCVECEDPLPGARDKYCSQRCQKRAYRREQKGLSDPRLLENRPA